MGYSYSLNWTILSEVYEEHESKAVIEMLKYLILDVDGTLTDGGLYYDDKGIETKKFCTKDGTGIIAADTAGISILVLTGRECPATSRRMKELGVTDLHQGIKDKAEWMRNWMEQNKIRKDLVGYIGDDINDLGPMKLCSFIGCPADACSEVKEIANYIATVDGGHGAVRDCIEHILKEAGVWNEVVNRAYGAGI